jgi:hypothetical protein
VAGDELPDAGGVEEGDSFFFDVDSPEELEPDSLDDEVEAAGETVDVLDDRLSVR